MTDDSETLAWNSLSTAIGGFGRVRLGVDHRLFVVTLHHQLHCLQQIQAAVASTNDSGIDYTYHHMKHCFDYLRQTILCQAPDTLEKGDFLRVNHNHQRSGGDLLCYDWDTLYAELDRNFESWSNWTVRKTTDTLT